MRRQLLPVLLACCEMSVAAVAADWPEWRGPERNGVSQETGLLQQWPADGPKLLWQTKEDIGHGYSTPSVVSDRIYLLGNKGLEDEFVQALSTDDGHQIWKTHIGKVGNPDQKPSYPGARSTPTIDGEVLYALGSDGDLVCLGLSKGDVKWKKNLRTDFNGKPGTWAYAESPLVDGDKLVITPGGKEATIVALNKKNGDVIWKGQSELADGEAAAYASITIVDAAGKKQYIQFLGKGLVGVDADTGKFLWRYDRTAEGSPANIATPVSENSYIYTGTHYSGGGAVKLSPDAGGVKATQVYYDKKLPTAIGGAVLVGENMYGTNRTLTLCVDFKTGKVKWNKERGIAPASVCYADGRLYLHGENDGDVALLEATPDGYQERGHFTPSDVPADRTGKAWTYPVIADGRLYIRDWGKLWCYDVKAPGAGRAAIRTTTPRQN